MATYLLRRIAYGVATVIGVLFLLFILFFAVTNPDEHRQRQETADNGRIGIEAGDGKPAQQHADKELAADDVKEAGDAHGQHAKGQHRAIDVGLAEECHEQSHRHPDDQPQNEQWDGKA